MKKGILFLLVLSLAFIIGCNGSITNVGSGPGGVEIKFIQPEDIIAVGIDEGDSIPIEIELSNKAECSAIGTLCIKDTLSDIYGGVPEQCKDINLQEAMVNNKKLEIDKQKFIFLSNPYSNLFKDQETNLQATVKYNCNLIGGPRRVCIQSPYEKDETKCKNVETISGGSLDSRVAPVSVTSITKQLSLGSSNEIKLKTSITLRKMSKGKVSSNIDSEDIRNFKGSPLKIEVDYAGNQMKCNGKDYSNGVLFWKSNENEKIINCEILISSADFQENPLNIHLNYDYEITENKLIKIKHIEKEGI